MATRNATAAEVLLHTLESHQAAEAAILKDYELAASQSADPGVRFLMRVILEDETRHHRWMSTMADGVRHSLQSETGDGPLPGIKPEASVEQELLAQTERFLQMERASLRDLRSLQKRVDWIQVEGRTLYGEHAGAIELEKPERTAAWLRSSPLDVIVGTMVDDTRRHIRTLQAIRD
ncbi:MAG: hypothetical protein KGJ86_10585, partial [Chloroflexota bacterium]|nr:hypothetical protein [Chloroflexota bacterium]